MLILVASPKFYLLNNATLVYLLQLNIETIYKKILPDCVTRHLFQFSRCYKWIFNNIFFTELFFILWISNFLLQKSNILYGCFFHKYLIDRGTGKWTERYVCFYRPTNMVPWSRDMFLNPILKHLLTHRVIWFSITF